MDNKEVYEKAEQPRLDALKRIRDEIMIEPQQPYEFTATEVADELGMEYKTTANRLNKLEREGKLSSRTGRNKRGYHAKIYRWVE